MRSSVSESIRTQPLFESRFQTPVIILLTGKSLDSIIEENRSKIAKKGTGGARPLRSGAPAPGRARVGGGRQAPKLKGIAGLTQGGPRAGAGARRGGDAGVIVGNTRYVKALAPGLSNAGVSKLAGRKVGLGKMHVSVHQGA